MPKVGHVVEWRARNEQSPFLLGPPVPAFAPEAQSPNRSPEVLADLDKQLARVDGLVFPIGQIKFLEGLYEANYQVDLLSLGYLTRAMSISPAANSSG